ncbi:diacylglycerol kinase [Colwellia psychrerythraea]|uniref:Diacylglycerol kinase n=1 Tax=Colwellia psychrerythraea TaxID=28229 RepID=A0A099K788_COLPS|nr:diacylglycerol kinase [Colwellia psychrerythraea]KGJ86619.1 diacylglycerol kinase [Colwellia psychrerythraea]
MNYQSKPTGLKRVYLATGHSLRALKWLIKNEAAFKQETVLSVVLFIITFFLNISLTEQISLWLTLIFVLFAEVVNTAIEAVVDRVGLEHHPLSGLAKDLGSLAVMLSLIAAMLIWLKILVL